MRIGQKLPLIIAIAFFIVGVATLPHYGINWDAPLHMMRGQTFVHYFLTGQTAYGYPQRTSSTLVGPQDYASRYYHVLTEYAAPPFPKTAVNLPQRPLIRAEFENQLTKLGRGVSFYQDEKWNGAYWLNYDGGHPPLVDILATLANRVFWAGFGFLGDIESYQLVYITISSLGIFLVSLFTLELTGSIFASLVAGLSLGLFPLFFAESHINMKDPEQAVFFTGALWAFYHWVKEGKLGWWGVFCLFVALALATKWNIVFLPLILIPWLFTIRKIAEFKAWFKIGKLGILGGFGGLGIILFLILIWPYIWVDPLGRLLGLFPFYAEAGIKSAAFNLQNFVPVLLLIQTPEVILALVIVGVVGVVREGGGKLKVGYLLLLWFLVTILRTATPGTWYYGDIRQIMEVIPAMALLAGVGAEYLVNRFMIYDLRFMNILKSSIFNLKSLFLILTFIFLLLPILRLHPNQNVYFNMLVGGLKGASERKLYDFGFTYGNVYKQAVLWLNQHAEKDANLAHLSGRDYAISPLWLRDDISLSPYHFSGFDHKGEYMIVLNLPQGPEVLAYQYPRQILKPLYSVVEDGVVLISVYKNDPKFVKDELRKPRLKFARRMDRLDKETPYSSYVWRVDLGQNVKVAKLVIKDGNPECVKGKEKNEHIALVPDEATFDLTSPTQWFVLFDKKDLGAGEIAYYFLATPARFIYIYPREEEKTCFKDKYVLTIDYLK